MKCSKVFALVLGMVGAATCLANPINAGQSTPNNGISNIEANAQSAAEETQVTAESNTKPEDQSTTVSTVQSTTSTTTESNTATVNPPPPGTLKWNTQDWTKHLYIDAGGGYIQTGSRFRGGGGSVDVGWNLCEWHGSHNIELQFKFLFESGNKSNQYGSSTAPVLVPQFNGGAPVLGFMFYKLKADFDQYPILLNYRFRHALGDSKFGIYAGAGAGVNIVNWSTQLDAQVFNAAGAPLPSPTTKTSKTTAAFIGQVFAGLSYKITDNLFLNGGGSLLFTEEYSWGNITPAGTTATSPGLHTCVMHWMVDAAFMYKF